MRGLALCEDWRFVRTGVMWGLALCEDWRFVRTGVMWGLALCEDWGYVRTGPKQEAPGLLQGSMKPEVPRKWMMPAKSFEECNHYTTSNFMIFILSIRLLFSFSYLLLSCTCKCRIFIKVWLFILSSILRTYPCHRSRLRTQIVAHQPPAVKRGAAWKERGKVGGNF